jgi:hypothetical protein
MADDTCDLVGAFSRLLEKRMTPAEADAEVTKILTDAGLLDPAQERHLIDDEPPLPFDHPAYKEAVAIFDQLSAGNEKDYRELLRRDRYLWEVFIFDQQLMNGGLDQYLLNFGDHAPKAMEALEAIGARAAHLFLKRACDLFPNGQAAGEQELREQQLRSITGSDSVLDDLVPGEVEVDLYQKLLEYWKAADPTRE